MKACAIAKNSPRVRGELPLNFLLSGISMKRVSQLTALALLMGLAAASTSAAETMPTLTLSTLQQHTASLLIRALALSTTAGRKAPTALRAMNRRRSTSPPAGLAR
jgi:hypothetical protein